MTNTSRQRQFYTLLLAAGTGAFLSSCCLGPKTPLVDQTFHISATRPEAHLQIVPRKVKHEAGPTPTLTGTFDLIVESGKERHVVDLGTLIGSGRGSVLTFLDQRDSLFAQDLNHDGTEDTNILHSGDGYALISFGPNARPLRLGYGTPGGGYANPEGTRPLGPISTNSFELDPPTGFRYREDGGAKRGASWNAAEQVFDID